MNNLGRFTAREKRNMGFALIETLISFVVLAVGLLALLSFHGESQRNISEAKTQAEAVAIAEEKLQELESFLSAADTRLNDGTTTDQVTGVLANFSRSWAVSTDATNDSQKTATVTVTWDDREGTQQSVVLSSNFFFRSPSDDMRNFISLVDATQEIAQATGGEWDTGGGLNPGNGEPSGDEDPVDPGDDQDSPTDPEDPVDPVDPVYISLTITGSVNVGNGAQFNGVTPSNSNYSVTCSNTSSSYTCTATAIPEGESLTFKLTFLTNKVVCVPSSGYYQFNNISSDISSGYNAVIRNKAKDC